VVYGFAAASELEVAKPFSNAVPTQRMEMEAVLEL
jgi:hypothetical protein